MAATQVLKNTTGLQATVLALVLAIAGIVASPQLAGAGARNGQTVETFAETFRAAYGARDTAVLKSMLYLDGTPDMTRSILTKAVALPEDGEVVGVTVVTADPADSEPRTLNGNIYVANIAVLNRIEVEVSQGGGTFKRFFVVGETPAGDLAIGGIKLAGEAIAWKAAEDAPRPETAEAFVEAYKAAYNAGDGATIAKMFYFEGTPDDLADFALAFSEPWGSITSVKLVAYQDASRTVEGRTYVPNLTDLQRVEYSGEQSRGVFSIGRTPEGFYAISGMKLSR